ncbi:MAG: hypothetical protein JWP16_2460 [Alphaproteobacteria bacterium]|nr:hypothetical protein [Alphaproteobacteria bacterium]MDB5741420.1 hypothetical protein [Alphaproteobacteria bacterium]
MNISLDRAAQEALFNLPNNDGVFPGELQRYLGTLGARRPAIVLAFPPKAAGTFLRAAAIKATGGELLRIVYAQGARDAQLYLPTLVAYYLGGFCEGPMVSHIHMQAFPANVSVLQAFGIRPVVMIRSIPDMLASYWDMLERSDDALRQGINCTIPPDFRDLPADRKADFLIDVLGPWYAGYYATWLEHAAQNDDVCVLRYCDFVQAPAATLETLLKHCGVPRTPEECQAAIDATWAERGRHRFNEGVEGRSHQYFAMRHLERIGRLLSYYPATTALRGELIGL